MHTLKNKILLSVLAICSFSFFACALSYDNKTESTSNEKKNALVKEQNLNKQEALEQMFQTFLTSVREGALAEDLYNLLTDTSEYWLDTLENHARIYTAEQIDSCQFYEAYVIIMYRLYEREHLFETNEDRMLYMMLSKSGMIDRFTRLKLGPMKVKNDRGSIGLEKSPEVPIMIFEWDDQTWKLNLAETVPLITKGIESIAVKKNWSSKKLALYWIEKEYHMTYSRLDESLLEPLDY